MEQIAKRFHVYSWELTMTERGVHNLPLRSCGSELTLNLEAKRAN
jgi:hypothetical protein